ncbi:MAG: potassium/proton antiporter [Caldilineales bacterium]|nr:potassium/proton antiporter [Caldilineales bacterium]
MTPVEWLVLIGAVLLLLAVLAGRLSAALGVPSLVLFLAIGMLAGSEGIGGIPFDNAYAAQAIGVTAMVFILFAGGLDTPVARIRPVLGPGVVLATVGVVLTATIVGLFAAWALRLPALVGLLMGAVVSSTDAAAVFSILRARRARLREPLEPLLELESGSNDPMAVILTGGLISLITAPDTSLLSLAGMLVQQMALGAAVGLAGGWVGVRLINGLRLQQEGLYPVATVALAGLTFGGAAVMGGSGFLAVYLAGILLGNSNFIHKGSLVRFHDSLAWLMQIAMFLTLGLLVFPSQLWAVAVPSLAIAVFLIVVARPAAVYLSLLPFRLSGREKALVAWVGLRGAVPIILATFPLLAGLPQAQLIFDVVFFVVLTSVLIQGTTIPQAARLLRLEAPPPEPTPPSLREHVAEHLLELELPAGSALAGRRIFDLHLPREILVVLIARNGARIIPNGTTELHAGDVLLLAVPHSSDHEQIRELLLQR